MSTPNQNPDASLGWNHNNINAQGILAAQYDGLSGWQTYPETLGAFRIVSPDVGVTPEPASLVLFVLGGGLLAFTRRRQALKNV